MANKASRYTVFSPPASAKNTLLKKLFAAHALPGDGPGTVPPQMLLDPGKETETLAAVRALATAPVVNGVGGLFPSDGIQQGDPAMFPKGVDITFAGRLLDSPNSAPDVANVKWTNAGDPANPYIPDISSPGPGKTDGVDKNTDPGITEQDIKPTYIPGQPNSGTREPLVTATKIAATNNTLTTQLPKGDSGANS
jgi:hypothetical protein